MRFPLLYIGFLTGSNMLIYDIPGTFRTSINPKKDLQKISTQQTNIIYRNWYNQIMEHFHEIQFCTYLDEPNKEIDPFQYFQFKHILDKINIIEGYFQSSFKNDLLYLAWMPHHNTSDHNKHILALIVCHEYEECIILKSIIPHPGWSSRNIDSKELRKCLFALENDSKYLNITEFLNNTNNVRFCLDWMI